MNSKYIYILQKKIDVIIPIPAGVQHIHTTIDTIGISDRNRLLL